MSVLHEADEDRWGSVAQVCRWGIVLVAMILVPGVAFLGQSVGQWLRARSESGWLSDAVRVELGHTGIAKVAPEAPSVELAVHDPAPDPADSAAMYDGRLHAGAIDASLASFDGNGGAVELAHANLEKPNFQTDGSRFAEAERELQAQGAVYYSLEANRESGYEYRFQCIMPAAGGNGAQQRFTATGRTPLDALLKVLAQIEHSAGRRP